MQSETRGLTSAEAARRLKENGPNLLKGGKKIHPLAIFFGQFKDVLIIILLAATVISFIMGETTEAIAIIAIVVTNAFLGFIQEYRTEKTIEALKNMAAPTCSVIRDGVTKSIHSSELVTGDCIMLDGGDRVPADARLTSAYSMKADEAMLTGESVPVDKSVSGGEAGRVHMGTVITSGRGSAVVTATGMDTEMGKIAGMLGEIEETQTPLQKRLNQLGKFIAAGCLVICAVVAVTGILKGEKVLDMLIMGISLAVAAVPEGLPAIVTISLALAVGRMVNRKALIRRLHAVETLGCASVICSDKTGTLTENRMTVKRLCTHDRSYSISGSGYGTKGEFRLFGRASDPLACPAAKMSLAVAALCNNSEIRADGGDISVYGDPTELALLTAAKKSGIDTSGMARLGEIPFDSDRKRMSVTVSQGGRRFIMTKGAPDVILGLCTHVLSAGGAVPLTHIEKSRILMQNEEMGEAALRVIGTAYRELKPAESVSSPAEKGLVFAGLFGMIDPPRKAAYKAVKLCRAAKIKPVMITGDHAITAAAIAKDLKICRSGDRVYTGAELDGMDDNALARAVNEASVFARVSPRHKLRIVRAFQKNGHVVAMTGDGVNDAPAVKEADIGVSMGITGADVTKEAAGVILLDDNFATLVAAVEEGRVIYRNIRKFIRYLLSCNVGEVLTMFAGMLIGFPVILLPIQILWVNLVTDGLPAIALGLDPPDGDVMDKPPRRADEGVFSGGLLFKIISRGILIAACTLFTFRIIGKSGGSLEAARTGAFLTLVLTQLIHVFECKSEEKSLFGINLLNNKPLIAAALFSLAMILSVIYVPFLAGIFKTVPLGLNQMIYVVLITLVCPVAGAILRRK